MRNKECRPRRTLANFLKTVLFVLLGILTFSGTGAASPEEEMKLLRMYFDENELFTSSTRTPKPVSRVAENVTVVTAEEIAAMNAHTVAEVLNRVPGLFVNMNLGIGSFGSVSLLSIQGSEANHVQVMVDDIPWNFLNNGGAETNTIPVGIIDRIEIIKGPGSSAWGPSLGGVVRIITKSPVYSKRPRGSVQGGYGERDTQDYRGEVSGMADRFGYYLFGGRQASDGHGANIGFKNNSYYAKLSYALTDRVDLGLSSGYSRPDYGLGDIVILRGDGLARNFWTNLTLDACLTRELSFNLSLFRFEQDLAITYDDWGLGGPPGSLFQENDFDETTEGGTARFTLEKGVHTAVLGVDFNRGEMEQTNHYGALAQAFYDVPGTLRTDPELNRTGVYLNDTMAFGRLSVTAGIRYDFSNVMDEFLSPSLGVTYALGQETLLRGLVARGFTSPPLAWVSQGGLFLEPNKSLRNESVWSYQAGLESAVPYAWVKATLFRHEIDDVFTSESSPNDPTGNTSMQVNKGESRRQGIELEAKTIPVYHVSLAAGLAYASIHPDTEFGVDEQYAANIGIVYDNPRFLRAGLFGHYIWWDYRDLEGTEYDTFIWDLNLSRQVYKSEHAAVDLFATVHNLFDASQYIFEEYGNPDRWVEAGIRADF